MAMLLEGDRILPAGTLVHIQGLPVRLRSDAVFITHEDNWQIIDELASQSDTDDTSRIAHGADPAGSGS